MTNMDRRSTIARFATLLGSFRLKELHQKKNKDINERLSALFSQESEFSCSVPSLSLTSLSHSDGANHPHRQAGKNAAEEHASSNLARSLSTTAKTKKMRARVASDSDSTQNVTCEEFVTLADLPHQMLENLAGSFLTLADARLRAYISILARHGVSLSSCPALSGDEQKEGVLAVQRKLETLIQVGTGVTIDNMVTFFRVDESQCEPDDSSMALVLETTMDVCIPKTCGGDQIVTVGASAKGWITANFDSSGKLLTSVEVKIDTHELLAQLIDRASLVMSSVLDIVRAVCALPSQFPQAPLPEHDHGDSVMPPPKPVAVQVSGQFVVVSPEVEPKRVEPTVTPFQLDETISNLSPESCANIIDFVIGEVDHIIFPPLKRHKSTA